MEIMNTLTFLDIIRPGFDDKLHPIPRPLIGVF